MGIEIQMTGSGELGPIAPGWNVSEFATPVTIGDFAGGTGSVSFNAASTDTSLFVVNNEINTIEENLGNISGVVKSVSETGLNTSVTHDTGLAVFDATKDIPALGSGGVFSALDLCDQLSGRNKRLLLPEGHYYSMSGHSAGFDAEGNLVQSQIIETEYETYYWWSGGFTKEYYRGQYGSIWADEFVSIDNVLYASHVYGDLFSNDIAMPTSRIAFYAKVEDEDFFFFTAGGPDNSNAELYGNQWSVKIDPNADTLTIFVRYYTGNFGTPYVTINSDPVSLSSLDLSEELAVFIEFTIPTRVWDKGSTPVPGDYYILNAKVANVSDVEDYVEAELTLATSTYIFPLPWEIRGNVRNIYRNQDYEMMEDWVQDFCLSWAFAFDGDVEVGPPVPALAQTNMWEYLQQACSAFEYEITLYQNALLARPIAQRIIDITNKTVPTISPNITLTGRSVDIVYTQAENIVEEEIYNARTDNNRIISVGVNETVVTTVPISGTPTVINLPYRGVNPINGPGEYTITQANGTQVPQSAWAEYGGRIDVNVSTTAINAIDITLIGPTGTDGVFGGSLPTYVGPFKLAYSSGNTDYAALSIIGTGVITDVQTLNLDTGADRTKAFQDVSKTVNNIFINTKEQAYDRGIWVASDASGPRVTMSATIPVSMVDGFGLVAGSRIWYRDSIYRITDATISNLAVSFNAVRHVTAEDFDLVWSGGKVGEHDDTWEGYDTSDHTIAPLRRLGDNESVLMFLDTDVNPYYDFSGDPEISVFRDTEDTNPYYVDGGNLDGEEIVYLDEGDDNPYV